MANIKKNFNFRNGVQVDDDNLLVTDTGLVGIGTTIPNEALDVRGNVVVTGFTSTTTAQIGVLTVTTFVPNQITGAGLSVFSGIVTAQGAGILTYFGDARNLQGMPTSQWEDKDVGLGFTSIYNTGGNVGVGTEDPRSTFQVGNNVDAGEKGVGISSVGNINMTGILTATSLIGNLTGDVTGRITGDVVGNVNAAGVSTFAGGINLGDNDKIQFGNNQDAEIFHDASSGINDFRIIDKVGHLKLETSSNKDVRLITGSTQKTNLKAIPTQGVEINFDGTKRFETTSSGVNIVGTTTTGQLSVTGVSTFTGTIDANGGATVDNVQIGVTGDNEIDTSTGNLTIDSAGGTTTIDDQLGVTGITTFSQDVAVAGLTTTKDLQVTGTTTLSGAVNATSIEVPNVAVTTKLGVGTTDTPVSDIQVTKSSLAEVQICSTGSIAQLNVGKEVGTSKTHTSQIRFGGGAGAPYSASGTSLDIINYDTGNFNYHISGNNANAVAGDFHWHKGINSSRLMTLTGIGGSLGIGKTQPSQNLDVEGGGAFSGNVSVGNNLTVGGALIGNVQGQLTGNVSGTLQGNSNATVGISTLNNLTIAGIATISEASITSIGIGTNPDITRPFRINDAVNERVFVSSTGTVGIQTSTILPGVGINASQTTLSVGAIGVGVTVVHKAVDFSNAGLSTNRMMVPPKVSSTAGLQNPVQGALVFNTTANKLQFYNGTSWVNV